eukprot:SM000216S06570  [mRNA]  locus=s216:85173:86374:+ [translate_table: standard]
MAANPKTTLYCGGLEESGTQKHRGFGFVTFLEKEDAAAAMDNMANAELFGRVLTVNYAQPIKIKGGEQGWANQPGMAITSWTLSTSTTFWADADTWFEKQQQQQEEAERQRLEAEAAVRSRDAAAREAREAANDSDEENEAPAEAGTAQQPPDAMVAAEAQALGNGS